MRTIRSVWIPLIQLLVAIILIPCNADEEYEYVAIGVSGGLQDGFPDHENLDYKPDNVQAIFLGRALVRGYKAYLDVMEEDWRQYKSHPEQPLINSNVLASGCWHHANEYWIYLVDSRQFFSILMKEPRFLSISPDLGLVDLEASETSPCVKHFALSQIKKQNKTDSTAVAFPIVTCAWYNSASHIPSPVLYTKEDGTQVTNFPQSLAKWAGLDGSTDMNEATEETCRADQHYDPAVCRSVNDTTFWQGIRQAIRLAESHRPFLEQQASAMGPPFQCQKKARFGVSSEMARINYPFQKQEIAEIMEAGGFDIDFVRAIISPVAAESL